MKVFIFEFFSATDPSAPEFSEGFLMLKTLINSFVNYKCKVSTVLHSNCRKLSLPGVETHENVEHIKKPYPFFDSSNYKKFLNLFKEPLANCDAALVIAPETGGFLANFTSLINKSGKLNLGSSVTGIYKTQNKYKTYSILAKNNVLVPETYLVDNIKASNIKKIAKKLGYPLIVKPVDGIGSKNVFLVESEKELFCHPLLTSQTLADNFFSNSSAVLLQKYIKGEHLSVTIIGSNEAIPVSLNKQYFNDFKPFKYLGGMVGVDRADEHKIFCAASQAWDAVGGLQGFGGVDVVVNNKNVYIIEINPRPTTPIVALSSCLKNNLAELLLQAHNSKTIKPVFNYRNVEFKI